MQSESSSSSSESTSSSSSSSSTPTSVDTASIAASVMADMDAGGDGSTDSSNVDTSARSVEAVDTKAAAEPKPEVDPDDFDAVQPEVTDSMGRKRANAIPHPRVKTMIAKAQTKVIAAVAKELGITKAEAELKLEDVTGALTERGTKFKSYEERISVMDGVERIATTDGDRFIRILADNNPQLYGKFLKVLEQTQTTAAAATVDADHDPEPQPDLPLTDDPNGPKTYSIEQLNKARAWDRRQAKREALADVDARFKPIEDERKAVAEAEARRVAQTEFDKRVDAAVTSQLDRAKKWPGFAENKDEILKVLQANRDTPGFDLYDAHQAVMAPKVAADRTRMREEILAEINGQPRNTSAGSTAAAARPAGAAKSTADIARDVMRELGEAA